MTVCEECNADLPIPKDVMPGEVITCPDCGEAYEIKSTSPFLVTSKAETPQEDWGQ
jgi:alpha-aminoadipate carrier protein LysW